MINEPEDKIENLKHQLYVPESKLRAVRRTGFSPSTVANMPPSSVPEVDESEPMKRPRSMMKILFLGSSLFFLVALGMAIYVFSRGGNLVSPANVELLVDGPERVKAGETLSFQVVVANHNSARLESVDLVAEFPTGSRSPSDLSKPYLRERFALGEIGSQATANQTIRAVVFGEKDVEQAINLTLEYRLADSNAIFDKSSSYKYVINDSPITFAADWPTEVNTGQTVTLAFEVQNNSTAALKDFAIRAEYPTGFIFRSANLAPAVGSNFWRLGDLAVGARRRLAVTGTIEGQDEDSKPFRFLVGSAKPTSLDELDLQYGELFKTLTVKRPYISLDLVLNGAKVSKETSAGSSELLRADITWVNNLPDEIMDAKIEVKLKGDILDERSVTVSDGFWQSNDSSIVWQKSTKPALARLDPGETGQVSFTFSTDSLLNAGRVLENPKLDLEVRFTGRQIVQGSSDQPIENSLTGRIKINSVLQLATNAVYHGGAFANTGPLPPKVGQETTYTVVWSVVNSSNSVRDATVRATLPTYMRWVGAVSPTSEDVTFNEATGEVLWDLGVVEAGRGLTTAPREAAFQVALRPSASQIGQAPVILTGSELSGVDAFTGERLNYSRRALDTRLLNDAGFRQGDEKVVN
ncbi:MAG: hypothetical protein AAB455_03395 [Patescibacteria group bacterium]